MTITVMDLETEEQVAEVHEDGTIDSQDPMVEEDIDMMLGENRAAPYRHTSYEPGSEENPEDEAINEEETMIQPGEDGYLAVVSEVLTFPYSLDLEETNLDGLSYPDLSGDEEGEEQNDDE